MTAGTAVPGQNTTFLPHKGVLAPSDKLLYVSYSDGAGPYDGTNGTVAKYNITSSTCMFPQRSLSVHRSSEIYRDGHNSRQWQ